ncbi:MAG: Flp pilus assembly complex ATPase component TadA, partial [Erysipelotrichaceae bacterium]|nr:Flp pilus assembly complex ATPase component TadA [Erysipelotrichaceae bacterium]
MSLFKKKKVKKNNNNIIQENPDECVKLVENSFLKGIFNDNVTDVSYNGVSFYAQDNEIGRYMLPIKISSDEVFSFIKKIANYMLKPFTNKTPSLDVSFGDYRLNAIHPFIARSNNQKVVTFSLRRITTILKIKENDPLLCPYFVHDFLKALMLSYQSVLISGQTGSGKTEFQKYLISLMNKNDRLIIIEESYETHVKELFNEMDVTSWIVNNKDDELSKL